MPWRKISKYDAYCRIYSLILRSQFGRYAMKGQDYTFRTKVETKNDGLQISHRHHVVMLGSCFTDNIGQRMTDGGMQCVVNPFGTLYNPVSILNAMAPDPSTEWIHSRVSDPEASFAQLRQGLELCDLLIVTFGTAFVYQLKSTGEVVANCKKMPADLFTRRRLSSDEIADSWIKFISEGSVASDAVGNEKGHVIGPNAKVLFTVSPIRHIKDGLHENQLSKSTLLMAIDTICRVLPERCFYFPSYEIMMDELRDYRFYADDMMHPSDLAIDYIWTRFCQTYMDGKTIDFIESFERLNRNLRHRPSDASSPEYIRFINETNKQLNILKDAVQNQ